MERAGELAKVYELKEVGGGTRYIAQFFKGNAGHTSRSIHLLTATALSPEEIRNPDPEEPLIHLKGLLAEGGPSGYDMGAELSPHMVEMLKHFTDEDHRRVERAMRTTYNRLSTFKHTYPFICETGSDSPLFLAVPGEATTLACERRVSGSYAQMNGHNIDSSRQQFALLAGLAKVQAIAAEKIKRSS